MCVIARIGCEAVPGNPFISCDKGSIAAPNKKWRQWDVRQVLPIVAIFAECSTRPLLTRNWEFFEISSHLRPLNHCPKWEIRQVCPIWGDFFIEAKPNPF